MPQFVTFHFAGEEIEMTYAGAQTTVIAILKQHRTAATLVTLGVIPEGGAYTLKSIGTPENCLLTVFSRRDLHSLSSVPASVTKFMDASISVTVKPRVDKRRLGAVKARRAALHRVS